MVSVSEMLSFIEKMHRLMFGLVNLERLARLWILDLSAIFLYISRDIPQQFGNLFFVSNLNIDSDYPVVF